MAFWKMEHRPTRRFVLDDQTQFLDWVALIAIAAAPGLLLVILLPLQLVLPVLSVVAFLAACGVALFAHFSRTGRGQAGQVLWDLACAFTLVWIVAGLSGNPRHLLDWLEQLAIS